MEEKNKKLSIILIGVSIGLIISIAGILVYKFYPRSDEVRRNGTVTKQLEVNHTNEDAKTNTNDKVVLDEEDVKKWLNSNNGIIELYYITSENDFDYTKTTEKDYSNFLAMSLLFGGLAQDNSIESITLNEKEDYNYQYSYPIEFIKNLLNKYFGIGFDMIDINHMNNNYKGVANFSMDANKFTVKVIATGLDNYNSVNLNKISLNDNNNIIVNYNIKDCMVNGSPDNCINLGNREVILKKTDTGYNLLKAYKVEN